MRGQESSRSHARELLSSIPRRELTEPELLEHSLELAASLVRDAEREQRPRERERAEVLARLMQDPDGQVFTTLLADRVYRSHDPDRVVDSARQLLRTLGVPRYMPAGARIALKGLLRVGPFAPRAAAAGVLQRLRRESEHVVLPADDPALGRYLQRRTQQGVRINVNHLGEAVLGEADAMRRVEDYVALLARPDIECISVKISSIFSQIDLLAWRDSVARIVERLRPIYQAALQHTYTRDGVPSPKLVTLDMEGYRDLHLTLEVFRAALDAQEFAPLRAGVVLQAYLPDSAALQRELTQWALARRERGGAPIRLRVVKGANLLAERAEAAVRGWSLPVYGSKDEVDANFKHMLDYGCDPARARAVTLGVASHNVFDIAFGMVLAASRGVEASVGFELLEGMADPLLRAVQAAAGSVLAYAPVCDADAMHTAIAYLLRRLDENTAEQNFLRHSFGLQVGDAAWEAQRMRFEHALAARTRVDQRPRRRQDRTAAPAAPPPDRFVNEPDTDFTQACNRSWLSGVLSRWQLPPTVELALPSSADGTLVDGFDPSRPGVVPYRFRLATASGVGRTLERAERASAAWADTSFEQRAVCMRNIAHGLRAQRAELIGAMVLDAGKRVEQADVEVSEAIDFAEYYARSLLDLAREQPELELRPAGPVLVTPPWNFPLAIPAGGVFAGLMAGNAVILKPALHTVWVAERLARVCWDAGVPPDVLQLLVVSDELGSALIRDPRIARVVLTGASETARLFQSLRPGLALSAETGGKNAIVVSALADRDEAIKDVLYAAFGHAGQKCSACSLLICEAEVYDDPGFMETLRDATRSLPVGPSWDLRSVVTPLIAPPGEPLLRGLTQLEPGEQWLVEPHCARENPRLWSPGIKLGVREGSFTHTTELFGPLLGVMRADNLDHAIEIVNATPYGLTSGLYSLDEREQQRWLAKVRAGNVYINRPITGAIVGRQPFGGWKDSSFGSAAKAGGPNYVLQLTDPVQRTSPTITCPPVPAAADLAVRVRAKLTEVQRERLGTGLCSYASALRNHFALDHDPCAIPGERNVFRYIPCASVLLRATSAAALVDVLLAVGAAQTAGVAVELSVDPELFQRHSGALSAIPHVRVHAEDAVAASDRVAPPHERLRVIGAVEPELRVAADRAHLHLEPGPVLLSGRVELLRYHYEQSVSQRYHRYGNLAPERLLSPLRVAIGTPSDRASAPRVPTSA